MRLPTIPWKTLSVCVALSAATPALADFSIPGFELVHSLPVATDLKTLDIRDPATVWCEMIDGARKTIDRALRAAAARGVKIQLMVANWSLTPARLPYLKSLVVLPNIEIRVVTIPEAPSGFIPYARVVHTKAMTIDGDIAWIGTSNWEGGYMDNSRNLEVVLRNSAMAEKLNDLHEQLWQSSYAAPLNIDASYPPPHPGHP